MCIQGNLARESVLYVVVTADSDQRVCYQLPLCSETHCFYIKVKRALLRQSFVRRLMVFEENYGWFHLTLSVFWVTLMGIHKTLGIWVRGYPKHGVAEDN